MAQQAWERGEQQEWRQDASVVRPAAAGTAERAAAAHAAAGGTATAGQPTAPAAPAGDTAPAVRLTSRGAVLLMIGVFTLGLLATGLFGWAVLTGLGFVAGASAAARYTRSTDLLTVAVTPPLVFFCVLLGAKAVTAQGNMLVSVIEGSALALASIAPWLFAGVVVNLVIAWVRGLPRCVSELRRSLIPPAARAPDEPSNWN